MTVRLPDRVAYRDALHAPSIAFPDPPLHGGTPQLDPRQQPSAASGAFAITFTMRAGGTLYAVRCFTQARPHLRERYAAVADFVTASGSDFLIPVTYQPGGIRVSGDPWPIVVMPWIEGLCLNDWVDDNLDRPHAIEAVRRRISDVTTTLADRSAAHGDLQHGNILVLPDGRIKLIDYDGMYLPRLAHLGAAERGHRNYQHPDRTDEYDASLDAFSTTVIDVSLAAVAQDKKFWYDFNHGDNLLFTASDFADADDAEVFGRLERIPALADRARRLRLACQTPFAQVADALAGRSAPTRAARSMQPAAPALRIIAATDRPQLLARDGEEVTVVGKVLTVKTLTDRHGGCYSLVNFGNHWQGAFTLLLWSRVRPAVVRIVGDVDALPGSYVSVTGYLSQHNKRAKPNPQIDLRHARALKILTTAQAATLLPAPPAGPARASVQPGTRTTTKASVRIAGPTNQRYASVFGQQPAASTSYTGRRPVPPAPPATPPRQPAAPQTTHNPYPPHTAPPPIPYQPAYHQSAGPAQSATGGSGVSGRWPGRLAKIYFGAPAVSVAVACTFGQLGGRLGISTLVTLTTNLVLLAAAVGGLSAIAAMAALPAPMANSRLVMPVLGLAANVIAVCLAVLIIAIAQPPTL